MGLLPRSLMTYIGLLSHSISRPSFRSPGARKHATQASLGQSTHLLLANGAQGAEEFANLLVVGTQLRFPERVSLEQAFDCLVVLRLRRVELALGHQHLRTRRTACGCRATWESRDKGKMCRQGFKPGHERNGNARGEVIGKSRRDRHISFNVRRLPRAPMCLAHARIARCTLYRLVCVSIL